MIFGILTFFAALVLPFLLGAALLWPAHQLAGGSRRRVIRYLGSMSLVVLVWGLVGVFVIFPTLGLASASAAGVLVRGVICTVLRTLGGWGVAMLLRACTPLGPGILRGGFLVGALAGTIGTTVKFLALYSSGPGFDVGVELAWIVWAIGPAAVYYRAAVGQRRFLRRHLRAACQHCGHEKGALGETCPECGRAPRLLCHRCRRFGDGPACGHCGAALGSRCWRCQYDWRGIESDRCPECGVWKVGGTSSRVSE